MAISDQFSILLEGKQVSVNENSALFIGGEAMESG